jgi:magnesium and cobalt transporter
MNNWNLKTWKDNLFAKLLRRPQNREQLIDTLRAAEAEHIVDSDAQEMLEGVLQVSQMQVRDIMVPRSQMVAIFSDQSLTQVISTIVDSLHSRYPVLAPDTNHVLGILLAKDILQFTLDAQQERFNLRRLLQPAMVVPETQHLDKLLNDFKKRRMHMAVVIDEYGNLAGLVTMEDVLEQIVGDIEDESDGDEEDLIRNFEDHYVVKAETPLDEFNEYFKTNLDHEQCETIGGLLLLHFGHIPKRSEEISFENFTFKVLNADRRRILLLHVVPTPVSD